MDHKQTLLFDLGGVIVRWTGIENLMDMTVMTRSAVLDRFANSPILTAYEIGQCDDDAFLEAFIDLWDLTIDKPSAAWLWQSWVEATYDGIEDVLKALMQNYNVACLSNTNALHWTRLETVLSVKNNFHKAYASHLIGAAKPGPLSYQLALDDMGAAANDVIFFDDTAENIEAALTLGMEAHLVDRHDGVIPVLKKIGLI